MMLVYKCVKWEPLLKIRCQQAAGKDITLAQDGYHGEYLIDIAQKCIAEHGTDVVHKEEEFFIDYAYHLILEQQKNDLADYRLHFDSWFSESTLHNDGAVDNALNCSTRADICIKKMVHSGLEQQILAMTKIVSFASKTGP